MKKVLTVLVVEDEAPLREALRFKLHAEGFQVFVAKDGKEGLESALHHHPDMLLVDIVMPIMNGFDMLRELRKDDWGKDAVVMLLTNLGSSDDIEQAVHVGVTDYIIKSDWQIEDVVEKIKLKMKNN